MDVKNLKSIASQLTDYWSPKVVGEVNDQYIKVAKLLGEFAWHKHDDEDELFLILEGQLIIEYEDRKVVLNEGEIHIVSRNTLHNPIANELCLVALVEQKTTKHTGDLQIEKTKSIEQQLK